MHALLVWLISIAAFGGSLLFSSGLHAAVAVISNRAEALVRFHVASSNAQGQASKPTAFQLEPGQLAVVPIARSGSARLLAHGETYEIAPDAAYYFGRLPSGKIEVGRIGLGEKIADEAEEEAPARPVSKADLNIIPVKILVDEEEPAKRAVWQRRLTSRVAAASDILYQHCGIKLQVVATGTWETDDKVNNFQKSVAEFIQAVDPGEARLAIGFTSQYQLPSGRTHLGGTRGTLSRHILLREWSQHLGESERLEVLVHELGHVLGAIHTPEQDTVMRPVLGDRQARARKFQIRFDPLNTLAMNLVAEEMRDRQSQRVADFSPATKQRLRAIYTELGKAMPQDPSAAGYLRILRAANR